MAIVVLEVTQLSIRIGILMSIWQQYSVKSGLPKVRLAPANSETVCSLIFTDRIRSMAKVLFSQACHSFCPRGRGVSGRVMVKGVCGQGGMASQNLPPPPK